jgi:hypothetical protein
MLTASESRFCRMQVDHSRLAMYGRWTIFIKLADVSKPKNTMFGEPVCDQRYHSI